MKLRSVRFILPRLCSFPAPYISDLCRKANYLLHVFSKCSPSVKSKIIASHCLSLYGCVHWKISNKQIKALQVTLNNILRKAWRLPRRCHTGILHCTANLESLYNIILSRFSNFFDRAMKSESALVRNVFLWSATRLYTTYGFNILNKAKFTRSYSLSNQLCAQYVRDIRTGILLFDSPVIMNSVLESICVD